MIGTEPFTDLDFADDVSLLTELFSVLVLAIEIMNQEAKSIGLQISWLKTKFQTVISSFPLRPCVLVVGNNVEVVKSIAYIGVDIHLHLIH